MLPSNLFSPRRSRQGTSLQYCFHPSCIYGQSCNKLIPVCIVVQWNWRHREKHTWRSEKSVRIYLAWLSLFHHIDSHEDKKRRHQQRANDSPSCITAAEAEKEDTPPDHVLSEIIWMTALTPEPHITDLSGKRNEKKKPKKKKIKGDVTFKRANIPWLLAGHYCQWKENNSPILVYVIEHYLASITRVCSESIELIICDGFKDNSQA